MARPITPISPKPFDSFSVSLPAATVVVLDPQPFNNTKEVILLNRSESNSMLVAIESLVATPAASTVRSAVVGSSLSIPEDRTTGGLGVAWGGGGADAITFDGVPLTAVGGPRVAGSDTFSVDIRSQSTLTVNNAGGLNVGDEITLIYGDGCTGGGVFGTPGVFPTLTLTGVAGPRVPGSNTFDVVAGAAAQAAAIATAINDSDFTDPLISGPGGPTGSILAFASALGAVITITAGTKASVRGANGDSPVRVNGLPALSGTLCREAQGVVGLEWDLSGLSNTGDVTSTDFTGGVNADGGKTIGPRDIQNPPYSAPGGTLYNRQADYAVNIAVGFNDGAGFAGIVYQAAFIETNPSTSDLGEWQSRGEVRVQADPIGTGGNGKVVTENTGAARIVVTSPTVGGTDAVPAALVAATSTVIPPGCAITLAIGSVGNREELGTDAYWALPNNPGSGLGLVAQMEDAGPDDLNVTYVNNRGYPEGV
jgi:hypothetical protein